MSRPIDVPRWAIYGLVFGLYLTARGYQSLDGDQAYRLPLLLHRQDPSLYANDPFVRAFDAFNPHRGYLALLDLATRPLGLEFGLFALFAATFALTCVGVSRLARAVWPGLGPNVGLVAVGLVLLARAGNVGTNHLFEPMLLDRLIGFALGWVALALAVEGETWRPSLLIGLAAVVHPTVGLQLGGLVGAGWVAWSIAGRWTGQSWRSTGVGLTVLGLALLPGVLPNLLQGRRLFEGLTAEEFRRIGVELQMAQHMVPSMWRRPQWLAWGGYVVVAGMSLLGVALAGLRAGITPHATLPRKGGGFPSASEGNVSFPPPLRWRVGGARSSDLADDRPCLSNAPIRFALLFAVLLAALGLSYVVVEVVGDLRVTVFQPFRMATIARGLALIALAGRCLSLWRRGDLIGRGRVLVLAGGLTGDWSFVVAVAFEVAATLGEVRWRSLASVQRSPHPNPFRRVERGLLGQRARPVPAILPALVLACGLLFLFRHDTERGHRAMAIALVRITGRSTRIPPCPPWMDAPSSRLRTSGERVGAAGSSCRPNPHRFRWPTRHGPGRAVPVRHVADRRRRAARALGARPHAEERAVHHAAGAEDVSALVGAIGRLQPSGEPLSRGGAEGLVRPVPGARRLLGEHGRVRPCVSERSPRARVARMAGSRPRGLPSWRRDRGLIMCSRRAGRLGAEGGRPAPSPQDGGAIRRLSGRA